MTTTTSTTPDLSTLTDDGDSLTLDNGRVLTLLVRPDDSSGGWNDQMDAECYGTVEWVSTRSEGRYTPRPDGFDGSARKILTDGYDVCWWQPPTAKAIGTVWTAEQWAEQTAYVRERVEYGWSLVGLRLSETVTDSLGGEHLVELDTAWIGGVDEVYPDLVDDLYAGVLDYVEKCGTCDDTVAACEAEASTWS